jgi:hypothetical protein
MNRSEIISAELKSISTVVEAIPFTNVFSVPEKYFSNVANEFYARLAADHFYTSENAFDVPQGYFENLASQVMDKIKLSETSSAAGETKNISSLIDSIGNKNIYTVPAGYFESLIPLTFEKTAAKVVKIKSFRTIMKIAAAAVFTGLMGIAVLNVTEKKNTVTPVENNTGLASVITKANDIIKTGSFDEALNSVSDNEIEQYLQQNGQDVNAALVASVADESVALPEASDYLFDEKTLDNFLSTNNLKN